MPAASALAGGDDAAREDPSSVWNLQTHVPLRGEPTWENNASVAGHRGPNQLRWLNAEQRKSPEPTAQIEPWAPRAARVNWRAPMVRFAPTSIL